MKSFKLVYLGNQEIRFECYEEEAPITVTAFLNLLPLSRTFFHARVSGQEIWFDDLPPLNIIQENASVFTEPGEVVLGPSLPIRSKTKNCFGIYYGEGKGLDACNIFARVFKEDMDKLKELGDLIWKNGVMEIKLELN